MNGPRFKHSPVVHLLGVGGTLFFAWLAYNSSVTPFVNGGLALKVPFVAVCAGMSCAVLALYLKGGLNRYEPTESGLRIHRLRGSTFHPWSEIRRIDVNDPLHYIVIRGNAKIIAFSSTDWFPDLLDLIRIIHERSDCSLPRDLADVFRNSKP